MPLQTSENKINIYKAIEKIRILGIKELFTCDDNMVPMS